MEVNKPVNKVLESAMTVSMLNWKT